MRKYDRNQNVLLAEIPLNEMICVQEKGGHLMLQPQSVGTY